jgi:hypothetical protein
MTEEDKDFDEFNKECALLFIYFKKYKPTSAHVWVTVCSGIIANCAKQSSNPHSALENVMIMMERAIKND